MSHHHASLDLLERLSLPADLLPRALELFQPRDSKGRRVCEGVVLSTCNRTEVYFAPAAGAPGAAAPPSADGGVFAGLPDGLVDLLLARSGFSRSELSGHLTRYDGWAAAEHLFHVVCGLDSLVVGESQIVGQVARAYAQAQSARTAGVVLSTLFQSAIRGGRRARTRTAIGNNGSNAGAAAVARVVEAAGSLQGAQVIVVGTGDIGRLVLQSLNEQAVGRIDVVSRTEQRAAEVAARWGGNVHPLTRLASLVPDCDVLISATAATQRIVTASMVRAAMQRRPRRRLVLVDLGVPRTIEPVAALIPGVLLLDIDSLKEGSGSWSVDDEAVVRMVAEDLAELKVRMTELSLRPVIGRLWKKAEAIREDVLARARQQLPGLDAEAWGHVEELAASLVARLLHDPATRLRAEAGNGHAASYADALTELFRLATERGNRQ